ncbi:hypothetical protein LCGC14_2740730, partial [marine sediment metagenome]
FTAMIASMAIGLGIDYAIHFISRLRDELRVDGDEPAALKRTMRTTGVSIIINAFSVGLGFTVLLAAGGGAFLKGGKDEEVLADETQMIQVLGAIRTPTPTAPGQTPARPRT